MSTDRALDERKLAERDREIAALQDLTEAMAAAGPDFRERAERVLAVGCEHLGFPTAFLSIIADGEFEVRVASGPNDDFVSGATAPLEETYCRHTMDEAGLCVVADASESMADDPAYARWGLESYVGMPVTVSGDAYGTICFADSADARSNFSTWQETFLDHLREWIESELEREQIAERADHRGRLLEATFDSPSVSVTILDPEGRVVRANETAFDLAGTTVEDVRGEPFAEGPWWDDDADLAAKCRDAVERAADGETVRFEADHERADGRRVVAATEFRPVYDDGAVTEIIVEGRDVTELKRREEQGEFFNAILRHDMLNGMNVIRARAKELTESLDGEAGEHAGTILEWSDDIIDLTRKVRSVLETLSSNELTDPEPVAIRPILESAAERARSIDETCTVTVDVDDVSVAADDLLDEVLGNVVTNAVEHGGTGVAVTITTTLADDVGTVRVTDDGPGVPPEDRDAVFERGEKAEASTGTGFGLFFVETMVDHYGGSVRVEENDAGGAAFVLNLPRA